MDLKNSNYVFDLNTWKSLRNKGLVQFVYKPAIVIFIISSILFFFIIEKTKGNFALSGISVVICCLIVLISRITTWYWKEYKYNRIINKVESYSKRDLIISIANVFRIAGNIFVIILIIILVTRVM